MVVGEICNREVVICLSDDSIHEAARLMRNHHVGDVIVVETNNNQNRPIGILTDRDIVLEVLAEDVDSNDVAVKDIMSHDLVAVKEEDQLIETIHLMRNKGVRRVPVVNQQGGLEGILAVDDAIEVITELMVDLVRLFEHEARREHKSRRP